MLLLDRSIRPLHDPHSALMVLRAQQQQAALLGLNELERKELNKSATLTFRVIEEKMGAEGGDE